MLLHPRLASFNFAVHFVELIVRLKYILLFLNNVNRDQEEALMQMKFHRAGEHKPMIETIDVARGINLLVQIKLDTTSKFLYFFNNGSNNQVCYRCWVINRCS